jgi:hypothetical protein
MSVVTPPADPIYYEVRCECGRTVWPGEGVTVQCECGKRFTATVRPREGAYVE